MVSMRKGQLSKPLPEHGDIRRYRHRVRPCNCDDCKRAWNVYIRQRRLEQRHQDPALTPTLPGMEP